MSEPADLPRMGLPEHDSGGWVIFQRLRVVQGPQQGRTLLVEKHPDGNTRSRWEGDPVPREHPGPVERIVELFGAADPACTTCGGLGYTVTPDDDPFGWPGDRFQCPCTTERTSP